MQFKLLTILVTAGSLLLGGCAGMSPNEASGTAIGSVGGALVGGAVSDSWGGAALGAVAGGVIGNAVGRSMD